MQLIVTYPQMNEIAGYHATSVWVELHGHAYKKKEARANSHTTIYTCPMDGCPAKLHARAGGEIVEVGIHIHSVQTWIVERNNLYQALRRRSMDENIPLHVIYTQESISRWYPGTCRTTGMSGSDSEEEEEEEATAAASSLGAVTQEIARRKRDPRSAGLFVSGWDDEDGDVEPAGDPTDSPQQHALWAAEHGELGTLRALLAADPQLVHARDEDGYTPLHRAAYGNHVEVMWCLLDAGAGVAARTELGWAPLHSAANWNNDRAAACLLAAGADINATTDGDQTALHLAAAVSRSRATLLLLLSHPDVQPARANRAGETALQLARAKGRYAPLFQAAHPAVSRIRSPAFTENPFVRANPNSTFNNSQPTSTEKGS